MDNRNVVITGATSGIGKATTILLAKRGWNVIAIGRNIEALDELEDDDFAAHTIEADLTAENGARNAAKISLELADGNIHGLVHAAGILTGGSMDVETDEGFDRQIQTNLTASFRILSELWKGLVEARGAAVLVSSVTGTRAFPGLVGYCVSKAGVDQLVRCAALDGAPHGVRVNGVNPGVVVTELHKRGGMEDEAYAAFLEHSKTTHPLGRVGTADEVAEAIAFLVGPESGWITGVNLPIDGGRHQTCAR